jgi:hypothetical protein
VTRDGPPDAHFRRMSGVMQEESGLRAWIERTRVVGACRFREVCARNAPCVGVLRIETARVVLWAVGGLRHSAFVERQECSEACGENRVGIKACGGDGDGSWLGVRLAHRCRG